MKKFILKLFKPRTLVLLLLASGIFLIGASFYIEYVLEVKPCQMCWWQRYIHWGITAIVLLGAISKKYLWALWGSLLASLAGLYVAVWHTLVQQKILPAPGCGDSGDIMPLNPDDLMATLNAGTFTLPSCDKVDFTIFNLSLANWNIITMFAFALAAGFAIWYDHHK